MATSNRVRWQELGRHYHLMTNDPDGAVVRHQSHVSALFGDDRQLQILDLGCGLGSFVIAATQLGHAVTGVDYSAPMLTAARANMRRHGVRASDLVLGDMRSPPLPSGPIYDGVSIVGNTIGTFSGTKDVRQIFDSARARLRPEGRIVVSLRDYSAVLPGVPGSPTTDGPYRCNDRYGARDVSQVWRWRTTSKYDCTVHIRFLDARAPIACRVTSLRAWRWEEIAGLLMECGFALHSVVISKAGPSVYAAGLDQIVIVAIVRDARKQ